MHVGLTFYVYFCVDVCVAAVQYFYTCIVMGSPISWYNFDAWVVGIGFQSNV